MFVSHKYKFLFLHNPKTGGSSVRTVLEELDIAAKKRECFLHSNATYSKACLEKNRKDWNDYFKFSIVRNPYSRMVSFYEHMRRIGARHERMLINYKIERNAIIKSGNKNGKKKIKDLDSVILWDSREATKYNYESFEDFIKNPYFWMHRLDVRKLNFVENQVDWLSIDGEIAVDYIMKLEDIKKDWGQLFKKINQPYIKFPHITKGSGKIDYKSFYTDELREIVANRFEKDLDYFGYSYD